MEGLSDEDFLEQFNDFAIDVEERDIFDRMREICQVHRIDAEEFVNQWIAFSHQGKIKTKLTLDCINSMAQWYAKKAPNKTPSSARVKSRLGHSPSSSLDSKTPDSKKRPLAQTPTSNKRYSGQNRTPQRQVNNSDSFSPTCSTPSDKYDKRQNRGEMIQGWGDVSSVKWKSQRENPISVCSEGPAMGPRTKYLFQMVTDKAEVLSSLTENMAQFLKEKHTIDEFAPVVGTHLESVTIVGRVCCETTGRLNAKSVVLQGSMASGGTRVHLDISKLEQFSLFPGQVVAIDGTNATGKAFVAEKIYEGIPLPLPEDMPVLAEGPLSMCVAAGPYCTSDGLSYQPLEDLVQSLRDNPPDVCVMLGPFLDSKIADIQEKIQDATFNDIFQNQMERLMQCTEGLKTQFVLVPSSRDLHHDRVFPQPPYHCEHKSSRFRFVSDPCTLNIEGVMVGITSTDVLLHLGAEETGNVPGSDRLGRLAHHILRQHSYYPLETPQEDMCIDWDLFDAYATLPLTPHILILPSDLKGFVKDVGGSLCINPGRLTKGNIGGTFARLVVPANLPATGPSISEHTVVEILRI